MSCKEYPNRVCIGCQECERQLALSLFNKRLTLHIRPNKLLKKKPKENKTIYVGEGVDRNGAPILLTKNEFEELQKNTKKYERSREMIGAIDNLKGWRDICKTHVYVDGYGTEYSHCANCELKELCKKPPRARTDQDILDLVRIIEE